MTSTARCFITSFHNLNSKISQPAFPSKTNETPSKCVAMPSLNDKIERKGITAKVIKNQLFSICKQHCSYDLTMVHWPYSNDVLMFFDSLQIHHTLANEIIRGP